MSEQVPGVPDGFELVAVRRVKDGELFLSPSGSVSQWSGPHDSDSVYLIVCKIEVPKQYRAFADAVEYMPHWGKPIRQKQGGVGFDSVVSVGDRVCYVCEGYDILHFNLDEMFACYEFADGSPFGVEVE